MFEGEKPLEHGNFVPNQRMEYHIERCKGILKVVEAGDEKK
jgi:hypothetical protein